MLQYIGAAIFHIRHVTWIFPFRMDKLFNLLELQFRWPLLSPCWGKKFVSCSPASSFMYQTNFMLICSYMHLLVSLSYVSVVLPAKTCSLHCSSIYNVKRLTFILVKKSISIEGMQCTHSFMLDGFSAYLILYNILAFWALIYWLILSHLITMPFSLTVISHACFELT
jgi:hypothetical protein